MDPIRPRYFDAEVYKAVKAGDLSKVQAFLRNGGWVNMPNAKGNTMFYYACKTGHAVVAKFLSEQGAHKFSNPKGKTGLENASEEVKMIVEKLEKSRAERGESNDLETHIFDKAISIKNYGDAIHFLSSITHQELRQRAMKKYAQCCALQSNFAYTIMKYASEKDQEPIAKGLIQGFLRCGDVESANEALKYLPESHAVTTFLELCVDIFSEKFGGLNRLAEENPPAFFKELEEGLRAKLGHYNVSEEELQSMLGELKGCGSYLGALRYVKAQNATFKALAREALGFSKLKQMAGEAIQEAIAIIKTNDEYQRKVDELLDDAHKTNDLSKLREYMISMQPVVGKEVTDENLASLAEYEAKLQALVP